MKHIGPISGIATYQNYIATTGYDNQIILWDAKTKKSISRSLHDHLVNQCEFSHDGQLLVSASSDYSARVWEVPSLRLKTVLTGHTDDIDMAVFSPDDRFIATCALDRTIKIFDLQGICLKTFIGHTGNIISVLWSHDAKTLVSCSVDGTVREWNTVLDGKKIATEYRCTDMNVRTDTLFVLKNGCILAGDDKGRIAIIKNGQMHFTQAHQAGIKKILCNASENILISLSYDRTMILWAISDDYTTLTEVSRSSFPALIWPRSGAFLNDHLMVIGTFGSRYATFDWNSHQWETEDINADQGLNALTVFKEEVYSVGDAGIVFKQGIPFKHLGSLCNFLLPLEHTLLAGGQLGQLFNVMTGDIIYEHHSPLNCGTTFYRNGLLHAIIGTYTGEALIFTVEHSDQIDFVSSIKIYENAIKGLVANHSMIFSVCASTSIAWHDIQTLECVKIIHHAHERIINGCCCIGDSGFASIGRDLKLRIWKGDEQEIYNTPHAYSVKCISISSNQKIIMTGSYGGTLAAFDTEQCHWISFNRPTAAGISSIVFDSKSDRFLASSYDGCIYPEKGLGHD